MSETRSPPGSGCRTVLTAGGISSLELFVPLETFTEQRWSEDAPPPCTKEVRASFLFLLSRGHDATVSAQTATEKGPRLSARTTHQTAPLLSLARISSWTESGPLPLNSSELVRLTRRMSASPAAEQLRYFQGGGRTQHGLIHVSEDRPCCSSRHPDHRQSPSADWFVHHGLLTSRCSIRPAPDVVHFREPHWIRTSWRDSHRTSPHQILYTALRDVGHLSRQVPPLLTRRHGLLKSGGKVDHMVSHLDYQSGSAPPRCLVTARAAVCQHFHLVFHSLPRLAVCAYWMPSKIPAHLFYQGLASNSGLCH